MGAQISTAGFKERVREREKNREREDKMTADKFI